MDDRILTVTDGDRQIEYIISEILRLDEGNFFAIFNLTEGGFMFGQFLGELPADDEEAIAVIYDDFRSGCKHITYPDGYIADDLYEMMDL